MQTSVPSALQVAVSLPIRLDQCLRIEGSSGKFSFDSTRNVPWVYWDREFESVTFSKLKQAVIVISESRNFHIGGSRWYWSRYFRFLRKFLFLFRSITMLHLFPHGIAKVSEVKCVPKNRFAYPKPIFESIDYFRLPISYTCPSSRWIWANQKGILFPNFRNSRNIELRCRNLINFQIN